MLVVAGGGLVAAGLVVATAARKVIDPTLAAGALRSVGWPVPDAVVRLAAAVELALGAVAVATGSLVAWWSLAATYVAFGGFVFVAMQRGGAIASCGCFGRPDTPPSIAHVVLNDVLAACAAVAAIVLDDAPLDVVVDGGVAGAAVLAGAVALVAVLPRVYAALAPASPRAGATR